MFWILLALTTWFQLQYSQQTFSLHLATFSCFSAVVRPSLSCHVDSVSFIVIFDFCGNLKFNRRKFISVNLNLNLIKCKPEEITDQISDE